jgi:hypothetical protein
MKTLHITAAVAGGKGNMLQYVRISWSYLFYLLNVGVEGYCCT